MQKELLLVISLILISLYACTSKRTSPKPHGYYRIELPQDRGYKSASLKGFPYDFEIPSYAEIVPYYEQHLNEYPYWINIVYKDYNAKIHISYKPINKNLTTLIEDVHFLVYKHTIKADAITQQRFDSEDKKTFGYIYEIGGNAACNVQFYLCDSTRHFLRGSLYFNTHPNYDSLSPVIQYFTDDIRHIMESIRWTKK
ncbi:MAG: gliding motility lipoprotein GldD [Bacteroidales bacterium]